jgi:hypothetical protein
MLKLVLLLGIYAFAGYWIWQGLYWIGTNQPGILFGVGFIAIVVVAAKFGDTKLAEW